MLKLAKVVQMRPEDNSADILFLDNGARAVGVPIMAGVGTSSRTGTVDQPSPKTTDKWSPIDSKETDVTAVIGWIANHPMIIGFLHPQVSQMLFADVDRRIMRHTSDVYTSIDKDGNAEFYHPSGAYIRFGTSSSHEDLTGKDFDGKWKIERNKDKPIYIHIEQAGGKASVDIAPTGAIKINTVSTLDVSATGNVSVSTLANASVTVSGTTTVTSSGAATIKAPSVKIDSPDTLCTGNLTVNGLISGKAGLAITGGTGASIAGNVKVSSGTVTVTGGDVVADGVSTKGHHHTAQGANAATTSAQA